MKCIIALLLLPAFTVSASDVVNIATLKYGVALEESILQSRADNVLGGNVEYQKLSSDRARLLAEIRDAKFSRGERASNCEVAEMVHLDHQIKYVRRLQIVEEATRLDSYVTEGECQQRIVYLDKMIVEETKRLEVLREQSEAGEELVRLEAKLARDYEREKRGIGLEDLGLGTGGAIAVGGVLVVSVLAVGSTFLGPLVIAATKLAGGVYAVVIGWILATIKWKDRTSPNPDAERETGKSTRLITVIGSAILASVLTYAITKHGNMKEENAREAGVVTGLGAAGVTVLAGITVIPVDVASLGMGLAGAATYTLWKGVSAYE